MESAVTPEERFEVLRAVFRGEPGVEGGAGDAPRKAFGASALKVDGKIFAMVAQGRLVVKQPRGRVDALIAAGEGLRFDPGHGRVMKEWFGLDLGSGLDLDGLAREALVFVGGKGS
jgi:hypothetical protein